VIYIAGSGRSGSTLLERTLGEMPGVVNVGELIDLFRRVAPRDERCGCGQPFSSCPFWTRVGERVPGGWDEERLAAVHGLQRRVARQRHLPRLLAMPLAGRDFRGDIASYGRAYADVYRAIAAEAGAACVVDASKWPVQALALSRAGIDVRVIHLVRDVRGVAHSVGRKDVARPHAVAEVDLMWRDTPARAAARWVACQTEAGLLRRCGLPVTRMHYEDFIREPRRSIITALTELGQSAGPADLAHVHPGRVVLGPSHGLSGNPSRFRDGEIKLRADEAWREQMSRRDRAVITAIGLPHLLRYGRRPGRTTSPAGSAVNPAVATAGGQAAAERVQWPLVSVLIPTRGRPGLVRESIAAVVAQTYQGTIECIVVHDQEQPDPNLARLGTPRRGVRVAANTHSPGLAGARNTGLDVARGGFIAMCDDDDVWHPDKLQAQIARLLDEPDLLVVGSGMRLLLPGAVVADWPGRAERVSYQLLLRNRVKELHSSTLVMRRDAFAKAGRYDEDLPHGYGEDYDWVLRAARVGRIGVVTRPLADVRKDGQSWYVGSAQSWYLGSARNAAAGLEYLLAKHPDIAASPRGHARLLGQIAFARSVLGERGPALRYAISALARWPVSPYPYIAIAHAATGIDPRHVRRAARLFGRGIG
jgi:hypothetical protein